MIALRTSSTMRPGPCSTAQRRTPLPSAPLPRHHAPPGVHQRPRPRLHLPAALPASLAAAVAANPAIANTTRVTDYSSPPDVLEAKPAELAALGPGGPGKALFFLAWAPLVWLAGLVGNAPTLLRSVGQQQVAPASLTPPFELHEEFVTVNGVRLHCVSPGGRRNRGKPLMLLVHGFPELWYS
jgi:hypothetical protein